MRHLTVRVMAGSCAALVMGAPPCAAAPPGRAVAIAAGGETRLSAATPDGRIDVVIATRPATPAESRASAATRCSGGWTRCSLVDGITITAGGHDVTVPVRAVLLLADIDRGEVARRSAGRYELMLECGDAAAAYTAHLFFDRKRVTRMDIVAAEAGRVEQSTVYHDVSGAFR